MVLAYTTKPSYRLEYILHLMLTELQGIAYRISHDEQEFNLHNGPKFSYADKPLGDEPFFYSTPLLFERGIKAQEISVFDWEGSKAFFATHPKYLMPFDAFAAAFYLVSRYEEYLPHPKDAHGRFDARHSLAYQKGFLHQAVVNRWSNHIGAILQRQFPQLRLKRPVYHYVSTIDIDNAWAFREKGIFRTIGALFRSLFRFEFKALAERIAVLAGKADDPYDTYGHMDRIREQYGIPCIYFFLVGDYGENDKNVSIHRKRFQSLIKSTADYNRCGVHPSYRSFEEPQRIRIEQNRLAKSIRREVTHSRQHFLRLRFPDTYRQLIDCDIDNDYTMGFAQEVGFRAGICSSFFFYDLGAEQQTNLRVHPFAVMDATLRYYMLLQPEEALTHVLPLIKEVKEVGGTMMTLWHNESLSDREPWEGWKNLYEEIVMAAVPNPPAS